MQAGAEAKKWSSSIPSNYKNDVNKKEFPQIKIAFHDKNVELFRSKLLTITHMFVGG